MTKTHAVEFKCDIKKVTNLQTIGGFRVTLDISGQDEDIAAWLMVQANKTGTLFDVVIAEEIGDGLNKRQQNDRSLEA